MSKKKYYWDYHILELISEEDFDATMPPERYVEVIPDAMEGTEVETFQLYPKGTIDFFYTDEELNQGTHGAKFDAFVKQNGLKHSDISFLKIWHISEDKLNKMKEYYGLE